MLGFAMKQAVKKKKITNFKLLDPKFGGKGCEWEENGFTY